MKFYLQDLIVGGRMYSWYIIITFIYIFNVTVKERHVSNLNEVI